MVASAKLAMEMGKKQTNSKEIEENCQEFPSDWMWGLKGRGKG